MLVVGVVVMEGQNGRYYHYVNVAIIIFARYNHVHPLVCIHTHKMFRDNT